MWEGNVKGRVKGWIKQKARHKGKRGDRKRGIRAMNRIRNWNMELDKD